MRHSFGLAVVSSALVVFGTLGTFGPSQGSLEGMFVTTLSWSAHVGGLPEVLQLLALSALTFAWVDHPERKWLTRALVALYVLLLVFAASACSPASLPAHRSVDMRRLPVGASRLACHEESQHDASPAIIPFVVLLIAACSGGADNSASSTPLARSTRHGVCQLTDDTVAAAGTTAASDDGCNTCTCQAAGWSCTELACP